MPAKQRNVGNSESKTETTNGNSTSNQKKKGPFSGRYNPT